MIYEALFETCELTARPPETFAAAKNLWLKIHNPRPLAVARLYCFSHVGGTASAYKQWSDFFPESVEVCAIQLPGREEREQESLCEDIENAVSKLTAAILQDARPCIFFGHSFGSILAFALASKLKPLGRVPGALIVSAKTAPHLPNKKLRSKLPRVQLLQELAVMGGTPPSVLNDSAMMDRVLRILRADYSLLESFNPDNYRDCLHCPIIAFEAGQDTYTTSAGIDAWKKYTDSSFSKYVVRGGHFYLSSNPSQLFSIINAEFEKITSHR